MGKISNKYFKMFSVETFTQYAKRNPGPAEPEYALPLQAV